MKHLDKILNKMCSVVKAKNINFKKPNWFHKHTWTQKQEDKFKEWMIQYLMDNREARLEIMKWPRKNKPMIKKLVDEFIWQYGWKLKEK